MTEKKRLAFLESEAREHPLTLRNSNSNGLVDIYCQEKVREGQRKKCFRRKACRRQGAGHVDTGERVSQQRPHHQQVLRGMLRDVWHVRRQASLELTEKGGSQEEHWGKAAECEPWGD